MNDPTSTTDAVPPRSAADPPEPLVIIVLPRILDLVIRQDRVLGPSFFNLNRNSYAIATDRLLEIVDRDELGLRDEANLPDAVILVAEPRQRRSSSMSEAERLSRIWSMSLGARVEWAYQKRINEGAIGTGDFIARVDRIGHDEFREIEAVLRREDFLYENDGVAEIYIHFAALYSELRYFAPHALESYFPALQGRWEEIEDLLLEDLDIPRFYESMKPAGAPEPAPTNDPSRFGGVESEAEEQPAERPRVPQPRAFARLLRKAERDQRKGNSVAAALGHRRAARLASSEGESRSMVQSSWAIIGGLVSRLQAALGFDDTRAQRWRHTLVQVFEGSARGFWNPNKRLLHDLQKVCVSHEREIYAVDLFKALRSLGRAPVKRSLPNRREVLMVKQLRAADSRLPAVKAASEAREELSGLIRSAAAAAEQQMRLRLRRRIAHSLHEPGLMPANLPEQVARRKLIEELLDGVVRRGFLTMGDVRDAISRSQLKISDLTFAELMRGDAVLRADRRLDRLLDGVYRGGEFYLRWLQRLSSLGFGSWTGRFVVKYVAVPFAGAWVILAALKHLWELVAHAKETPLDQSFALRWSADGLDLAKAEAGFAFQRLADGWVLQSYALPWAVMFVGAFLLGMIYWVRFRQSVIGLLQSFFRGLKSLCVELPRWLQGLGLVQYFLRSRVAKWSRRYLLTPLVPAVILCLLAWPFVGFDRYWALGFFLVSNVIFNSRRGRDFEELVGMWLARAWYRFRFQFLRSFFEFVMSAFRQAVEVVEKLLYAIDEWLLFKGGENRMSLWFKAVVGTIWSAVAYVVRFAINLLVEPQINPIKHFPVVTVSHKVLITSQPFFAQLLTDPLGNAALAQTIATTILFVIPGIFGFLVWELKSNWLLYEANRDDKLKPAVIGDHGESMLRLLKPGFHSGTIAKIFGRMRRVDRQASHARRRQTLDKMRDRLHHQEVAIAHFFERELIALLEISEAWPKDVLSVARVATGPNGIRVQLAHADTARPLELLINEQSGWLVAKIKEPGWLHEIEPSRRSVFNAALAGFYRLSAVDLTEEQMQSCLVAPYALYHLRESDVDVWSETQRDRPVSYHLRTWGNIRPQPSALARGAGFPTVPAKRFLLSERLVYWDDWVKYWNQGPVLDPAKPALDGELKLLPA